MEELIPWLYLKGVSTGDFSDALAALLGKDAPGLSAATIGRLKTIWQQDFEQWQQRDLSKKCYVYFWVDGIFCNVRMDDKQCLLVIIGATEDGIKELVAIEGGYRESEMFWSQLLLKLRPRASARTQARRRRWGLGILEGPYQGLGQLPRPTLLGS